MKDVIKAIIDKYGIDQVKYGVVVFGTTSVLRRHFAELTPSRTALKNALDAIPRSRGQPDLKRGLEESAKLFENTTKSANIRRILVVMIDKNSVNSADHLRNVVQVLERKDVLIIPVAIGNRADSKELQALTPNKGYIAQVSRDQEPEIIAQEIMKKALTGEACAVTLIPKLNQK